MVWLLQIAFIFMFILNLCVLGLKRVETVRLLPLAVCRPVALTRKDLEVDT